MADPFPLPADLPVPDASQVALHLGGHPLPPLIELPSTSAGFVDLFLLSLRRPVLLFIYPRTAAPGEEVPDSWNQIAGARGCTPHLCNVRDSHAALLAKEPELAIFGLSTQPTEYQQEAAKRLQLPFDLLSDHDFRLQKALDLPTFTWQGTTFLQRCTLLLREGQVTQFQHPVFPPTKAAQEALRMLDAGKPAATAATAEMSMNDAYVDAGVSSRTARQGGSEVWGRDGGDGHARVSSVSGLVQSSSVPRPRDLTGSIRSFKGLERAVSRQMDWRNSLVAVDTETGEVIGVLAQNVALSSGGERPAAGTPLSDDDVDEIPTPKAMQPQPAGAYFDKADREDRTAGQTGNPVLKYTPAATYHDPDVRPRSREGSVLGEDTFAPPPVPDKPQFLRTAHQDAVGGGGEVRPMPAATPFRTASQMETCTEQEEEMSETSMSDGEAIDGQVRTRAKHVEAHRPDLLRDMADVDGAASDASGSTVGGPVIQLWRKARGGKQGEAKRRAKRDTRETAFVVARNQQQEEAQRPDAANREESVKQPNEASITIALNEAEQESELLNTDVADDDVGDPHESGWDELASLPPTSASVLPPSMDTVNAARAHRVRREEMITSEIRSIEDRVWQSALECGSLPIDAPYTHLPAFTRAKEQGCLRAGSLKEASETVTDGEEAAMELVVKGQGPNKKIDKLGAAAGTTNVSYARHHMQGNSVLIEFLAGSRIAASVIRDAASHLLSDEATAGASVSQNAAAVRAGPDAFTPTSLASIPQTGALRYIPVLPSHLLWFFGFKGEEGEDKAKGAKQAPASSAAASLTQATASQLSVANVASMGGDMMRLVSTMTASAPAQLMDVATRGASAAWYSMSSWSIEASNWVGARLMSVTAGTSLPETEQGDVDGEDDLHVAQPGDEDADEWEWRVPAFDDTGLHNTPRPVYRRKRPVPSLYGGFQVRQQGDHEDAVAEQEDGSQITSAEPMQGYETIQRVPSRYSIVHFDHEGVGRHALLNLDLAK